MTVLVPENLEFHRIIRPARGVVKYTPNGADLTVKLVDAFDRYTPGVLFANGAKQLPDKSAKGRYANGWNLTPGAYLVTYNESIHVPVNCVGFIYPRSSLLRMGAQLVGAVWDAGYEGIGASLVIVHNPGGIIVEQDAPIAQIVFHYLDRETKPYAGQYQHEGLQEVQ